MLASDSRRFTESGTARFMTSGGSRLLASRDYSLASAGGDHPPVGVDFVIKSGSGNRDNFERHYPPKYTVSILCKAKNPRLFLFMFSEVNRSSKFLEDIY